MSTISRKIVSFIIPHWVYSLWKKVCSAFLPSSLSRWIKSSVEIIPHWIESFLIVSPWLVVQMFWTSIGCETWMIYVHLVCTIEDHLFPRQWFHTPWRILFPQVELCFSSQQMVVSLFEKFVVHSNLFVSFWRSPVELLILISFLWWRKKLFPFPGWMPEVLEKVYYLFPGEWFGEGRNYFCFGSSPPSVKVGSPPSV